MVKNKKILANKTCISVGTALTWKKYCVDIKKKRIIKEKLARESKMISWL